MGFGIRLWCRENAFAERLFVLREVCNWAVRGEDFIAFPRRVYFDDAGIPLVGWRTQLVAECLPTHEHFQSGSRWDSNDYREIRKRGEGWMSRPNETGPLIMAIAGKGTVFEDGHEIMPDDVPPDCILFVEVLRYDIHWAEPRDIDVETLDGVNGNSIPDYVGSELGAGFHIAFRDGEVWFVSRKTPASLLAKFASRFHDGARNRWKEFTEFRIR